MFKYYKPYVSLEEGGSKNTLILHFYLNAFIDNNNRFISPPPPLTASPHSNTQIFSSPPSQLCLNANIQFISPPPPIQSNALFGLSTTNSEFVISISLEHDDVNISFQTMHYVRSTSTIKRCTKIPNQVANVQVSTIRLQIYWNSCISSLVWRAGNLDSFLFLQEFYLSCLDQLVRAEKLIQLIFYFSLFFIRTLRPKCTYYTLWTKENTFQ